MLALLANPLVRKIAIYAAISLAVLYAFRLWLNKHDARVFQEGKEAIAEEQRKRAEETIKLERENLAKEKQSLTSTIDLLNKEMAALHGNLNEAIKQAKKTQANNAPAVMSIPDSDLNSAIRAELQRSSNQ